MSIVAFLFATSLNAQDKKDKKAAKAKIKGIAKRRGGRFKGLGSTRLSQKHLIEIEGKPMIKWLVDRFDFGFKNEILEKKIKIFN